MNKLIIAGCFVLAALFAGGCKKADAPAQPSIDAALKQKVTNWLNRQQTPAQPHRVALSKAIQENLQWERAWKAQQERDDKLLIVPIGKGVTFKNNGKRNVDNYLVIYFEKTGEVFRGRIFQRVAGSLFTKNTIPAFYGNTKEDLNGTYIMLSIHDIFYSEATYDNNKLKEQKTETTKNNNARTGTNCVDWYLVTTYYNTETGAVLYQTETYLGTNCSGCVPYTGTPQTTLTGETEWDCNTGGGGGGGDDDEGYFASREREWHAYYGNVDGIWATVWATDRLKGKYNSNEPQGGHFKGMTFLGTSCNTQGVVWEYGGNWQNYSGQSASSRVTGRIKKADGTPTSTDRTRTYTFTEVFG